MRWSVDKLVIFSKFIKSAFLTSAEETIPISSLFPPRQRQKPKLPNSMDSKTCFKLAPPHVTDGHSSKGIIKSRTTKCEAISLLVKFIRACPILGALNK